MVNGHITYIFFDFGDTLAYSTRSTEDIWTSIFKELGVEAPTREDMWRAMKEVDASHGIHIYDYTGKAKEYWTIYDMLVFERLGLKDIAKKGADLAYKRFRENKISAYPDAKSTLKKLKAQGYILGIISNYTDELTYDLRAIGLDAYFEHVIISQLTGAAKPDPRIFKKAMEKAGCDPKMSIHVGNSYEADVVGAQGIGITPILVDRHGKYDSVKCHKVKALAEIPSLISKL